MNQRKIPAVFMRGGTSKTSASKGVDWNSVPRTPQPMAATTPTRAPCDRDSTARASARRAAASNRASGGRIGTKKR